MNKEGYIEKKSATALVGWQIRYLKITQETLS